MLISNFNLIFWNLVVFAYFLVKNFFFSKVFKNIRLTSSPILTLITAVASVLMNFQLQLAYSNQLSLTYVKGAIQLPPFTLLFILADFISSLFLSVTIARKISQPIFNDVKFTWIVDFVRLIGVYIVFTSIITSLWVGQYSRKLGSDFSYECFKSQLVIDLASYYYRNHGLPQNLEQFTEIRKNPLNNSELNYYQAGTMSVSITDNFGNKIVEGYKNLTGIGTYVDEPAGFFTSLRIINKSLCGNTLKIPAEFSINIPE